MSESSDIRLSVASGPDGVRDIAWEADDAPEPGVQHAKAMFLALWDADARNALRIDLWTRDLTIDDMNDFLFQTLLTLADTYRNATGDKELMSDIKIFAREFAEKASNKQQRASP
jgi:gliding motility-associated protein GldC